MKHSLLLALSSLMICPAEAYQQIDPAKKELSEEPNGKLKPTNSEPAVLKLTMHKAIQGSGMTFSYNKLPDHEALNIKFKVHFVGPWDGTGFKEWGPDRFIATVDNKIHLLDATFNNCHIIWSDNIWQSFPDPHQYRQLGEKGRKNFLYHGGEGAKAISSLGFAWNRSKSVDSSYEFNFTVKHNSSQLDLTFLTKWVEDNSPSTYWIEDLDVLPITTLKKVSSKKEETAWKSFLLSDGHQAQKAWAEVYAAHPEKFLERVQSLIKPNPKYVNQLINKLGKGRIPTRALQKEIFINPKRKDARQLMDRILTMRELALIHSVWSTPAEVFWNKLETTPQTRAIRKAMATSRRDSLLIEQITLRLSSYLRMINTYESLALAAQLDSNDPDLAPNPFLGDWKEKQGDFGFTIKKNGEATSSSNSTGTWRFTENNLIVTWESGNTMEINLMNKNRSSAVLNRHNPQEAQKKTFIKLTK